MSAIDLSKAECPLMISGSVSHATIGYGAPQGAKKPLEEIAAMSGGKSKFVDMDEIREMEKEIGKKPKK